MTTETIEQASELVDRAEINAGGVLVEYSRTEAALAELRSKYAGAKFDLTTTAGDKAARAARLELVTLRTGLEKKRKELKAPAVEFGKKIDDEAKRITGEIVALEDPIDAQIKADEKRREEERLQRERIEADRVAAIKTRIDAIRSCVVRANAPDMTSERIQRGIDQVEAIVIDKASFAEFEEEAAQAKSTTLAAMLNLRDTAKAREDEAARLEAQRIENERIAAEQRAAAARARRHPWGPDARRASRRRRCRVFAEGSRRGAGAGAPRRGRGRLRPRRGDAVGAGVLGRAPRARSRSPRRACSPPRRSSSARRR